MEIIESVKKLIQEMIVPELDVIKAENGEIKATLVLTNKRLDDINVHLADQSRRIDETNKRIDDLRTELTQRIDKVNADLIQRMDDLRADLTQRIDKVCSDFMTQYNELNGRLDRLYAVIVRRDEHSSLEKRVANMEREIDRLKKKFAA
jgi:chromosome segregation ATPase